TSGRILIDGNEINKMNTDKLAIFRRRQIGIVYQFYNLIPILTAEENITLPIELDGKDVDKERLEDVMSKLGILDKKNNLPNQLSGGQQQRVSIGRALMNAPSVVLADEPTGNLDSRTGKDIMDIFHELHNSGNTIVLITHDDTVARQAQRSIHILDGHVREVDA
ncbi:MAG TPA: peptide ABC transporter ATP-binding protein, partial [Ruminococcaceae bacterium]|nr:peptide ABC transporter ATP-binding protein [Oscillospiraceae bacterium]